MLDRRIVRDLEWQVGAQHAYTRPADLAAYAFDANGASGARHLPDAVVFPATSDEVSRVVQVCAAHRLPVVPRGAGTGYSGGSVAVHGGVVVNLCRMSSILGLDAGEGRIHVEAGVVTAAVHRRAADAGAFYPPDPGASTTSTIGGNVACNAAGPHALRYGTTADHLLGATAVLADGRIARLGRSAEDYSSLLPLLCGSEGTLAIITEATLRLIPAPAARATISARFADMERAAGAVAAISKAGIVPAALEFLDRSALAAIAETGIVAVPGGVALILVEVDGTAAEVEHQAGVVRAALETAGARNVEAAADPADAARLWMIRKAISAAVAKVMIGKINEDVVVPRDRIAELIARTEEIGDRHQVPVVNFGHLGDGNLHVTFLIDPRIPGERARGQAAAEDLFASVLAMSGSVSGEHGVGTAKLSSVERQLSRAGVELMQRIKTHYDPEGLLNPGVKIPALAAVLDSGAKTAQAAVTP